MFLLNTGTLTYYQISTSQILYENMPNATQKSQHVFFPTASKVCGNHIACVMKNRSYLQKDMILYQSSIFKKIINFTSGQRINEWCIEDLLSFSLLSSKRRVLKEESISPVQSIAKCTIFSSNNTTKMREKANFEIDDSNLKANSITRICTKCTSVHMSYFFQSLVFLFVPNDSSDILIFKRDFRF